MFLLGHQLADNAQLRIALTSFYGISFALARQICARIQLNETGKVGDLTDAQVTLLSAYLSSGSSIPARAPAPTRSPFASSSAAPATTPTETAPTEQEGAGSAALKVPHSQNEDPASDPLRSLVLEGDLRRAMRENIRHLVRIGTYRGRRHLNHKPVRGQRTNRNAITAKKLNRVERRAFGTAANEQQPSISSSWSSSSTTPRPTVSSLLSTLPRPKW